MISQLLNPKEPEQDIFPSRKQLHGRLATFYTTSTCQPLENGWNLTCSSPLHSTPHSWDSSTSTSSGPGSPGCRGGRSWGRKSCLGSSKRGPCWRAWSCLQTFLIFKRFGSSQPIGEAQCGQEDRASLELAPALHTIPLAHGSSHQVEPAALQASCQTLGSEPGLLCNP